MLWPWLTVNLRAWTALYRGAGPLRGPSRSRFRVLAAGHGDEVRQYLRTHPYPEADRGIGKGLERLGFLERVAPSFAALGG